MNSINIKQTKKLWIQTKIRSELSYLGKKKLLIRGH